MTIACAKDDPFLISSLQAKYGHSTIVILQPGKWTKYDIPAEVSVIIVESVQCESRLHVESPPVLALTTTPTIEEAIKLLSIGVKGYGNRKMREENLFLALETIKSGHIWLPPDILVRMIELIPRRLPAPPENTLLSGLSKREKEVAEYVVRGMTNQEIAEKLFVSLRTIKAHLSSIYDKTGLRNRLELGLRLKGYPTAVR
jgi:DNA-binding NarL/FixJ family response regulator